MDTFQFDIFLLKKYKSIMVEKMEVYVIFIHVRRFMVSSSEKTNSNWTEPELN